MGQLVWGLSGSAAGQTVVADGTLPDGLGLRLGPARV